MPKYLGDTDAFLTRQQQQQQQ